MSTPRRRGAGSKAVLRKRVGTPGGAGLEFDAAVQADSGGLAETFSYEDVSNLETLTPSAKRAELRAASKAAARAERNGGGKTGQEKGVGSGRKRKQQEQQQEQQQQQQQEQEQQEQQQQQQERQQQQQQQGDRTMEKGEGGAAKRRRQRQQQQAAAAAEVAAAASGEAPAAAPVATISTTTEAVATAAATATAAEAEATEAATPAGGGRRRPEHVNTSTTTNSSSSKRSSRENGVAGAGAGGKPVEVDAAGRGGVEKSIGEALRSGDKRKRTLSPKGQGAAMAKGQGKAGGTRGGERTRPTRKIPPYPEVVMERSGRATNMAQALVEAVDIEIQGLIRQRGHEPTCKAAVHACVDVAKEIRRQAVDIGIDLDPPPKLDLKELRRMFLEEKERQVTLIEEEKKLWKAEEQKCLALVEKTRRAKEEMERSDKARADYGLRRMGNGELRALMDPMGTGAVGGQEEEEEEEEGGGLAKRVSNELLVSTNNMLVNAGAIGRSLQEMGGVVADGQETKDRLIRVFRKHALKKYPNVNDPKAAIAAMLQ